MSDLKQANAVLEEARAVLAESNENLSKSIRFTDQALINQRSLILAMSNLLPRPIQVDIKCDLTEEEKVEGLAIDLAKNMKTREVFDIVHAINVLAMANTDVMHIFTSFSGHVNKFSVYACAVDTCYQEGNGDFRLLNEYLWLDGEETLEKLLSIESQLTELIIEAREEAEAKAGVEA